MSAALLPACLAGASRAAENSRSADSAPSLPSQPRTRKGMIRITISHKYFIRVSSFASILTPHPRLQSEKSSEPPYRRTRLRLRCRVCMIFQYAATLCSAILFIKGTANGIIHQQARFLHFYPHRLSLQVLLQLPPLQETYQGASAEAGRQSSQSS